MTICLVKTTAESRYRLSTAFKVLNITQLLLGVALIAIAISICCRYNIHSEKTEVNFVFIVIAMYGAHVIIHYVLGMKICHKCHMQAHKYKLKCKKEPNYIKMIFRKSTRYLLALWTFSGCNIMINMIIISVMAAKISKHIVRSMKHSLEKGMHFYLQDVAWKKDIDRLQYKLQCCGVDSYKNWYAYTWVDNYHINTKDPMVEKLRLSQVRLHLPIIPWSCCKIDFPMQCLHDPFQQLESQHLWDEQPNLVLDSINTNGCLIKLKKPIENALVSYTIITMILVIGKVSVIILSRILYTACRNAVLLGDLEGLSPGWIFGRGDCGWKRGPTLFEIMATFENDRYSETTNTDHSGTDGEEANSPKSTSDRDSKSASKTDESDCSECNPVSTDEEEALMLT